MKKILFILTLFLFITSVSFAQLENANWCFKYQARVNFNTTPPTPMHCSLDGGGSASYGGNSMSASDANGQLLFYSDGIEVYDRNGNVMPHGADIGGGAEYATVQTAAIVPKPNNPNLYYIFLVNMITGSSIPTIQHMGLHYVMVDMTKNGGLGDIVYDANGVFIKTALKNQNGDLIDYDYATTTGLKITESRISSTLNADGSKIWLSFFTRFDGNSGLPERWALQYLVSETGINSTADGTSPMPTTSFHLDDSNFPVPSGLYFEGSMKFSPDGKYLCDANIGNVTLYQFDNRDAFGTFTFDRNLYPYTSQATYAGLGVEFSHDSKVLYFATRDEKIYQDGLIPSPQPSSQKYVSIRQIGFLTDDTVKVIGKFDIPPTTSSPTTTSIPITGHSTSLQLAIDNKIYLCAVSATQPLQGKLGVINKPWVLGAGPTGCDYSPDGIILYPGTLHEFSLPQWVHVTGKWPKVYYASQPRYLTKDKNQNLLLFLHDADVTLSHLNHQGALPLPPYTGKYTFHYTHSGFTNYTKTHTDLRETFPLTSGNIQTYDYDINNNYYNIYFNGSTGQAAIPPILVPQNEKPIAETSTGDFITSSADGTSLHLYTPTSHFPLPIQAHSGKYQFNKNSDKLYFLPNTVSDPLKVYLISGNTLSEIFNSVFITIGNYVNVDDQDNLYVLKNSILQTLDYNTGILTQVNIPNFQNSKIREFRCDNPYTTNNLVVLNKVQNYIYFLKLDLLESRKILVNGVTSAERYAIDGDYLFLAGTTPASTSLGTQVIPYIHPGYNTFITKLNLLVDFNFQLSNFSEAIATTNANSYKVELSPNPSNNFLKIIIIESKNQAMSSYTVSILNSRGNILFNRENYMSGTNLNITNLPTGVYFVEVVNSKGEKVSKSLIKL